MPHRVCGVLDFFFLSPSCNCRLPCSCDVNQFMISLCGFTGEICEDGLSILDHRLLPVLFLYGKSDSNTSLLLCCIITPCLFILLGYRYVTMMCNLAFAWRKLSLINGVVLGPRFGHFDQCCVAVVLPITEFIGKSLVIKTSSCSIITCYFNLECKWNSFY